MKMLINHIKTQQMIVGLINSLDKETLNTISKSDALNSLDVEFEVDNNVNPEIMKAYKRQKLYQFLMKTKHLILIKKKKQNYFLI